MRTPFRLAILSLLLFSTRIGKAQDPNFFIFLSFGQSNMEGQGAVESSDRTVDSRFRVFQTVDCSNLTRTKNTWYTAVPPLCRCWTGLSPVDYFGRMLVDSLPSHIKIGVINVSVGGCRIELFDKDIYEGFTNTYTDAWFQDIITSYNGNPYTYLVDAAKLAQQKGVIKGILLHQGETNTGDNQWPAKVKKIYNDLTTDLELDPTKVPLLAGELVHADQGGLCASMNTIINKLPQTLPNSYVISSSGCTDKTDNIHFNSEGYRELGRRYGATMLSLLEYEEALGLDAENITGYFLSQNYPNPVNEKTAFTFRIPHSTHVSIKLYDLLGTELSTLTDAEYPSGEHSIDYHFTGLAKGLYIYTMRTADFAVSRRLVVQ